jgi:DNA-nicking Smr family endonuclease
MQQLGLKTPAVTNIGGILPVQSLSSMMAAEEDAAAAISRAQEANNQPVISSLVAHIKNHWSLAKKAKQTPELEMLSAVRSRRGEYDPDVLSRIRKQGGSEIYMMLFATKARQAKALLTDVLIGAGTEKPWTITPTPKPDLPPAEVSQIMQGIYEQVAQLEMMGQPQSVAARPCWTPSRRSSTSSWRPPASTPSAPRSRSRTCWWKAAGWKPSTSSWMT